MKSLTITFNSKEAAECARTFLTNQNAPYRNSSTSPTKGVDVNTGEKFESRRHQDDEIYSVTFSSSHWANRAEKELEQYFNTPNKSTHTEEYKLFRS